VASTEGFAVGDLVRIGTGSGAETGIIVGFGSILLQRPLVGSFGVGTVVELIPPGSASPTATAVIQRVARKVIVSSSYGHEGVFAGFAYPGA
jgi:hypothetical protein